MQTLTREILHATRRWWRTPVVSTVVVASLALGIGANTAIFEVYRSVILAPYDLPGLDRLVALTRANVAQGRAGWPVPPLELADWRAMSGSFSGIAGSQVTSATLTSDGDVVRLVKHNVTADFFQVLGHPMALGRAPSAEETVAGGAAVVVLSHRLWRARFGADPRIIGRLVTLDGIETEVVGVAHARLDFPEGTDIWTPLQLPEALANSRTFHTLHAVGRLAPGVTLESAQEELTRITERLEREYPATNQGERAEARPLAEVGLGTLPRGLAAVFVGAGLVLLLTCLNVSVLFVVRSLQSDRDAAVRTALGADRLRRAAPALADAVLLGACTVALGAILVPALLGAIRAGASDVLPHAGRISMGWGGVGLLGGLTLVTCALSAVVPVARALRADTGGLRARRSGWGRGGASVRRALIGTEMGLALVTLVAAGLMLRTFISYAAVDTGIDRGDGLMFKVTLPASRYPAGSAEAAGFFPRLYESLEALPGVRSAGGSAWFPWLGPVAQINYTLAEHGELEDAEKPVGYYQTVGGSFFAATGVRILEGRGFDDTDRPESRGVAVVTPAFVRAHGLEGRAVGTAVSVEIGEESIWEKTIVGVVEDVPMQGLERANLPALYTPLAQVPWASQEILVRTTGDPMASLDAVFRALASLDPGIPAYDITTLDAVLDATTAQPRVQLQLLGAFAGLAVILAVLGAYGVLSFLVATRTREIGVRLALGATGGDVGRLVLREGLFGVIFGAMTGLAAAWVGARLLEGLLFGVAPRDLGVFVVATAVVGGAGGLAALVPGLRASRIHPRAALTGPE